MTKESFTYPETGKLLELIDEATRRSGVSRGQAFEDFLHMGVCAMSGGAMEEEYLDVVKKHSEGEKGKRGCDSLAECFGALVSQMEETQSEMKDVLGDLFQGGITYGENGQFLTPEPICRMMAKMTTEGFDPKKGRRPRVADPCCGSGRMLLAVAEEHRNWEFHGQDVDLRCVRMTALNLAFRNLYGYVIQGNSLTLETRLAYRTGFNGRGVIQLIDAKECPVPDRLTNDEERDPIQLREDPIDTGSSQLHLF